MPPTFATANQKKTMGRIKLSGQIMREMALGIHGFKPAYTGGDVCRWFDAGDIIEFTGVKYTFANAEFEINGRANHKIWFSQLNGVYLHYRTTECVAGVLTLKDGRELSLYNMRSEAFWSLVKGKKFRVLICEDFPVSIDRKNDKVRELKTLEKITNYIFTNLDNENYNAVEGMTKKTTLYSFEEI
jgi:hypothetical protein